MCGIIGAVANRNIVPILVDGLKRLEYRGYDSAGLVVIDQHDQLQRLRRMGKVQELADGLVATPLNGHTGIAHTRWATHGAPSERNAHPHISGDLAIVHNGIIENYVALRSQLQTKGYEFTSDTDTEVIVHLIHSYWKNNDLLAAVQGAIKELQGAFALAIIVKHYPQRIIGVRQGSPLIIGIGKNEHFLTSDHLALLSVTQQFIFLEEGDLVDLTPEKLMIYDCDGKKIMRPIKTSDLAQEQATKGDYQHFMLKEIFEQAVASAQTLEGRLAGNHVLISAFGTKAEVLFPKIKHVQIVACGTSYHAGLVARYWLEQYAQISCQVEIASEFRYRDNVVQPDTLFLTLSQSGETADTLAALRKAKEQNYLSTLTICNKPESSLIRESELSLLTRAGPEMGVASTKAFTTQLTALLLFTACLAQVHGQDATTLITALRAIPEQIKTVLQLDPDIKKMATHFSRFRDTLFLGRGVEYPIALEAALKLKEISYIHAEAYPAGELKHGPLALVDENMPVIVIVPNDHLVEKLLSNVQEVNARGGRLFLFADQSINVVAEKNIHIIKVPTVNAIIAPIIYNIPLQLFAYHVAVLLGNDVDQPRNLAKSVTVE
ncbi:MAG: glutamine--fructose-6-phosphate transaminase (isomerizing) [Gammaproteobacteria bacterium]|nr:glutamine--fructose-6-phosphate transaminase (isomerizing) [Gammaproteobacteria bacterium]